MGLRINGNTPALTAQRQIGQTANRLTQGLERMASGLRINRAADDAAGLAIAERFRTQATQYGQEATNLQTGVSVVQAAEGGMASQQEGLQRLRELAVQGANGTLNADQRAALNTEAQQIVQGIDETANETEFNGTKLLNGATATIPLGTQNGEAVTLNASTSTTLGVNNVNLGTPEGAQAALENINNAINTVSRNRSNLGAQENRFTQGIAQRETGAANAQESESRIRDLDIAKQSVEQARNNVLMQGGIAALVQANISGQNAARLLGR